MTSGIYKLTFSNKSFYIGKSNNIERRWEQHFSSMTKGTHAKALQAAFNKYGEPKYFVLIKCHEDHIDILEGLMIHHLWSDKILNGNRPKPPDDGVIDVWNNAPKDFWLLSTPQHFIKMQEFIDIANKHINISNQFKEEIENIKSGTIVEELEDVINLCKTEIEEYKSEILRLKNRSWFDRLFNTGV